MAGHLLAAGHRLTVHSRTRGKAEVLVRSGARWADTPAQASQDADVIFVCVTDTPDVEQVLLGRGGVIESAREGQIVVDHSTISPSATRDMADRLAAKGILMLDAPVSGGDVGAKNAALSIMVGGEENAFTAVQTLLQLMGKTITWCGKSGSGQLTKLVNQILAGLTNLAVCEALNFAKKSGLDANRVMPALAGGAAGSWQFSNLGPKMLAGDFLPGFTVDLMLKDLRLIDEEARRLGLTLKALPLVHELFHHLQKNGDGKLGTQALFKAVSR